MAESSSQPPPTTVPPSAQPPQQPSQTSSQDPIKAEIPTVTQAAVPVSASASAPAAASDPPSTVVVKEEPDLVDGSQALDTAIDRDIDMNTAENSQSGMAVGGDNTATKSAEAPAVAPGVIPADMDPLAAAPPSKKETSLREFLGKMDEYAPIIPDAVTAHYLTVAGLPPPGHGPNQTPPHLARLLALATQKFIADIAADSYQYARIRASNSSSASNPMGSLNAAAGLSIPGAGASAGGTGAAAGSGGEAPKGKAGTHLGIQRPGFGGGGSGGSGQGRTVLTMEDLGMAVAEYGVNVKRGEFYR